jgi:hypothetical protein
VFNDKGPRNIEKWQRASDLGYDLFVDGISCGDIVQGALGDCYLLSALAVMSSDSILDMFESEKDGDKNNWKKTGHFCIRFTKEGVDEFVIVDDYIPLTFLDGEFKPAFTKGGRDGKEIWPCIIEKAYAKWYSSYSIIESGKIPLALSDMNPWGVSE